MKEKWKPISGSKLYFISNFGRIKNNHGAILKPQKHTGVSFSQISGCCLKKPKYKTAGGFKWSR